MDCLPAALGYNALRLCVIPLRPGSKKALLQWKQYELKRPSEEQIKAWFEFAPDANLAIVCGEASGNLLVFDVDDFALCAWVQEHPLPFMAVETGSHKLHLYARTLAADLKTETLEHEGAHLGEIRGHGSYVVAPPSRVDESDHDQPYLPLWESQIPTLTDARALFHLLAERYLRSLSLESQGLSPKLPPHLYFPPRYVMPPLKGDAKTALWRRINECSDMDAGTKALILHGQSGEFTSNSHSEWGGMHGLVVAGFTDDEIEEVYATFPVGKWCYQNVMRNGSYGHKYLRDGLSGPHGMRSKVADERVAAEEARGENFRVVAVKKKLYDEPVFEITIDDNEGGKLVKFECLIDDVLSEGRLRKKLSLALGCVPRFIARGKQFTKFSDAILRMAVEAHIPEDAKATGVLWGFVVDRLKAKNQMLPTVPTDEHVVSLGWLNPANGHVHIRGGRLLHMAGMALHPSPTPEKLWSVIAEKGGEETTHTFTGTGTRERVWSIPAEYLGKGYAE